MKYEFHPAAEIFPLMDKDSLKAMSEDILNRHLEVPIELFEGKIIDGRNRYLACTMPGGPSGELKFVEVDVEDPIGYVMSLNFHRRHMNESQRAMVAAKVMDFYAKEAKERQKTSTGGKKPQLKANLPEAGRQSRDDAAKQTNVSPRTVQHAAVVIKGGSAKVIKSVEEGRLSVSKASQIVKSSEGMAAQDDALKAIEKSKQVTRIKGLTGEIEWYTPKIYLDSAVVAMTSIDLDPASSTIAQKHVRALKYYTIEKDGLSKPWFGNVFLNPPYRMPLIKDFVSKLCEEYESKSVSQAILLTNGATDTEWFHMAAIASTAFCLTKGRIHFIQCRDGEMQEKANPTCGQAFFYFGDRAKEFALEFKKHGSIFKLSVAHEASNGR